MRHGSIGGLFTRTVQVCGHLRCLSSPSPRCRATLTVDRPVDRLGDLHQLAPLVTGRATHNSKWIEPQKVHRRLHKEVGGGNDVFKYLFLTDKLDLFCNGQFATSASEVFVFYIVSRLWQVVVRQTGALCFLPPSAFLLFAVADATLSTFYPSWTARPGRQNRPDPVFSFFLLMLPLSNSSDLLKCVPITCRAYRQFWKTAVLSANLKARNLRFGVIQFLVGYVNKILTTFVVHIVVIWDAHSTFWVFYG